MNIDKIKEELKNNDINFLKLQFTDILGNLKEVEIPIGKIEDLINGKIMFDGSSIVGFVRIKEADMCLVPDFDTFLIIRDDDLKINYARFICDIYLSNGKPFEGDPRYILKKALKKIEKNYNWKIMIGIEPEFYLLDKTLSTIDEKTYFDCDLNMKSKKCRYEIIDKLKELDYTIETMHHEVGPGQNEITFRYDEAIKTCDRIQLYKYIVKKIANKYDLIATFMPKPFNNLPGNGMHINFSIFDGNKNIFEDLGQPLGISKICRKWINGILNRSKENALITNPTVNSYKRISTGFEAPCYICWSDKNRSSLIRIPAKKGKSTRIEIRNVDGSINPYLVIASLIEAGMEGMGNENINFEPIYENIFELSNEQLDYYKIDKLPNNLFEAIHKFKNSDFEKRILGDHLFFKYLEAKTNEWNQYNNLVQDYELKKYL